MYNKMLCYCRESTVHLDLSPDLSPMLGPNLDLDLDLDAWHLLQQHSILLNCVTALVFRAVLHTLHTETAHWHHLA